MQTSTATATAKPKKPPAVVDIPTPKSLAALARDVLAEHNGMTAPAIRDLASRIASDDGLLEILAEDLINEASQSATYGAMLAKRASIMRTVKTGMTRAQGLALVAFSSGSLLDFPLAGGLRLADASRDEVERQAAIYAARAADEAHKARWLSAVAAKVPAGKKVGDVLDAARVTALYEEAK